MFLVKNSQLLRLRFNVARIYCMLRSIQALYAETLVRTLLNLQSVLNINRNKSSNHVMIEY